MASSIATAGLVAIGQLTFAGPVNAQAAPGGDVLDVEFDESGVSDAARGVPGRVSGDPEIYLDPALDEHVAGFDGVSDIVQFDLADQYEVIGDGMAAECVFRFDGEFTPAEQGLCSHKQNGGWGISVYGNDLTYAIHLGGSYRKVEAPIEKNRWYHAVGVYTGDEIQLYINGDLAGSVPASGEFTAPTSGTTEFALGGDGGSNNVPQKFAASTYKSAAIFSDPLSAVEVRALYEASDLQSEQRTEIAESTPADGEHLTAATQFDVRYEGGELFAGEPVYLLDGDPIEIGQLIGPGLAAGEHTVTVSATDVFGREFVEEIRFTTGNIPVDGGTESTQGAGTVTLSANAVNPSGADLVTTFTEGATSTADGGFQGFIDDLPDTLEFEYSDGAEITGALEAGDGESAATAATEQLAFQRFDLALPEGAQGDHQLVWHGAIDPERTARMFAWNTVTHSWDELASSRGVAEGQVGLTAAVGDDHVAGDTVHAMMVGYDPFADDVREQPRDGFAAPSDYDFAISHHTDPQYLSQFAVAKESAEERAVWTEAYESVTRWVAENAESRNIAFHANTGDLIQNWWKETDAEQLDRADQEFGVASRAQAILDDAGVVNSVLPGNHDNVEGMDTGADAMFNTYFGPDRYQALETTGGWEARDASHHPWKDGDSSNHYVLFSAGGLDFISVSLGYVVTDEEAAWADSVLKQYPDRNAIVLTHAYNAASANPDGRGAAHSVDGQIILDQVVTRNPNVALVLSGHIDGVSIVTRTDVGQENNHVVELLADYQYYEFTAEEVGLTDAGGYAPGELLRFGASFLRLLQFDLDRGEMIVDTYSPMFDDFGATEHDRNVGRYDGNEDDTRLPIQFETRKTSFSTDGMALVSDTGIRIGEDRTRSGWPASVEWSGLESGRLYAWYATSRDAVSGDEIPAPGSTRQFAVFTARAAGTDTTAPVLTVPQAPLVIELGTTPDLMDGVTATDDVDGDITSATQLVSSVDTTTPGQYTVIYTVSDANGNQAIASRVVVVGESSSGEVPGTGSSDEGGSSTGLLGMLRGLWTTILGGFGSSS